MLRIAVLYPDLLGTYGDGGNAEVVDYRARQRGTRTDVLSVGVGDALPAADLYLIGGGEDGPQRLAADRLRASDLGQRIEDGAVVFAVCAGLQILGESFAVEGDAEYPGLGAVAVTTVRGERRRVGDLVTRVGEETLVGFENHGGHTTLGSQVLPWGTVVRGTGNDGTVDGFRWRNVIATYAHGPALALNPWLADLLLSLALGRTLEPLATVADQLHAERVATLR